MLMKLTDLTLREDIHVPGSQELSRHFSSLKGFDIELDSPSGLVWIRRGEHGRLVHVSALVEASPAAIRAKEPKER